MRCAEIIHYAEDNTWRASLFEYGVMSGSGIGVMLPVRDGGETESPLVANEDAAKEWALARGAVEFWPDQR